MAIWSFNIRYIKMDSLKVYPVNENKGALMCAVSLESDFT